MRWEGQSRVCTPEEFQTLTALPHEERGCCNPGKGPQPPMRINVYAEEMTDEVTIVKKTSEQDQDFFGIRFFLDSPDVLHHTDADDDRSAVTFWVPWTKGIGHDPAALRDAFLKAANHLRNIP